MIRRRPWKSMGIAQLHGAVMHELSGFDVRSVNNRTALRRRPTRIVSRYGIRALRTYNLTGTRRLAQERSLRRMLKQPRAVQPFRRMAPMRARKVVLHLY